jgi:hypothetical protein
MYSSTVWQDKPLFRISFNNIDKVMIVKDDMIKQKFPEIKFIFQIHLNTDSG